MFLSLVSVSTELDKRVSATGSGNGLYTELRRNISAAHSRNLGNALLTDFVWHEVVLENVVDSFKPYISQVIYPKWVFICRSHFEAVSKFLNVVSFCIVKRIVNSPKCGVFEMG